MLNFESERQYMLQTAAPGFQALRERVPATPPAVGGAALRWEETAGAGEMVRAHAQAAAEPARLLSHRPLQPCSARVEQAGTGAAEGAATVKAAPRIPALRLVIPALAALAGGAAREVPAGLLSITQPSARLYPGGF